jgi:hypothetical protein
VASSEADRSELHRDTASATCDFCGAPRANRERQRLVWDSGRDGELVLAELCARCARRADELVALFGGRGREAMRLSQHVAASPVEPTPVRRVGGVVGRGVVYVLVAVVAFLVVTFLGARP